MLNYSLAIGPRRLARVDIDQIEPRDPWHRNGLITQFDAEHLVKIGRSVRADQQYTLARISERDGRRRESDVLPTPPLPVKNRKRGASLNQFMGAAFSAQVSCRLSRQSLPGSYIGCRAGGLAWDTIIVHFQDYRNMKDTDVIKALAALAQSSRLHIFRALVVKGNEGLTPAVIAEALDMPATRSRFI